MHPVFQPFVAINQGDPFLTRRQVCTSQKTCGDSQNGDSDQLLAVRAGDVQEDRAECINYSGKNVPGADSSKALSQGWLLLPAASRALKIVARDIDAYQRLIDALLQRDIGIDRYFTYIVIKTVKDEPALPLSDLVAVDD